MSKLDGHGKVGYYLSHVLLAVILAFVPLLLKGKLELLVTFEAAVLAAMIGAAIGFVRDQFAGFHKVSNKLDSYIDNIISCQDNIDKRTFYRELLCKIDGAQSKIKLMYLGRVSPTEDPDIKEYAKEVNRRLLKKIEATNGGLTVKRIVLDTEKNRSWVLENCEVFSGKSGFTLGSVPENEMGCGRELARRAQATLIKKPLLSVQIIDDEHVFIVDPTEDVRGTRKYSRYLYLNSRHAAEIFNIYFDCIMEGSTKILDHGECTAEAKNKTCCQSMDEVGL